MVMGRLISQGGRSALFFAPAAWVATEYLRGYLFGGFPWVPLGNSQVTVLPIAQLASVARRLRTVRAGRVRQRGDRVCAARLQDGRARLPCAATVVLLVAIAAWGASRVADGSLTREGTPIRVGLFRATSRRTTSGTGPREARRSSRPTCDDARGGRRGAEFVIWPESSTPFISRRTPAVRPRARAGARGRRADSVRQRPDRARSPSRSMYNAAFLLTPDGATAAVYRKIHLVPFGEFVPLQRVAVLRRAAGRGGTAVRRRRRGGDAAGRRPHGEHGDLLRGGVSRR